MIIEHDFGRKERRSAKRFWKPPGAEAATSVRPFGKAETLLELANARVAKLEAALRDAHAAASPGEDGAAQAKILVDAAEYARLLRCRELVAAALSVPSGRPTGD